MRSRAFDTEQHNRDDAVWKRPLKQGFLVRQEGAEAQAMRAPITRRRAKYR